MSLHHWIPKIMVKFSNLTLYKGTKTVSMGWVDLDWKGGGGGGGN